MPPQYPIDGKIIEYDDISISLQRTDSLSSAESSALPASPSNFSLSAAATKPAVDSTTTTTTATRKNGQYTVEEVAKHNKKDDAWLIYNNQVVDVSKWVSCSVVGFCHEGWLTLRNRF